MVCKIIKDKRTGEEMLIPGCIGVINHWHIEGISDWEIIKEFCCCVRPKPKNDKYETKNRDEVFALINNLKDKIAKMESQITQMKDEVFMLEAEVFCLNTVEVE